MAHDDDAHDGEDTVIDGDYAPPGGLADPFEVQSILADMEDFTNDDLPPDDDFDEDFPPDFSDDDLDIFDDEDSTDAFTDDDEDEFEGDEPGEY